MFFSRFLLVLGFGSLSILAYIPASPTNDTERAVREGGLPVNQSDVSTLSLQWFPTGSYELQVSYQLAGAESDGLNKGALLHFSEDDVNEGSPPTLTPWIALVSCDRNATNASEEIDIFTLARDKGAVAAVLYSLKYEACIINPEYADPETYDQVFDIFSTKSLSNSALIDYQFGQFTGAPNKSIISIYDSKRLNDSAQAIQESVNKSMARSPGYLLAILRAYNSTASDTPNQVPNDPGYTGQHGQRSNSTSSAMIVLYSITGIVSALFVAVIVSGAVRAIRHPERYGPRAFDTGSGGGFMPAHARGLTRAIVDTFPIFKFSSASRMPAAQKDVESGASTPPINPRHTTMNVADVEMADWVAVEEKMRQSSGEQKSEKPTDNNGDAAPEAGPSSLPRHNTDPEATEEVMPDAIGHQTCPICIVDFEEGDDLRMLPCEGKHVFHQTCVDPWLLELSSSCPLCRQDFAALESMLSGNPPSDDATWRPQSNITQDPRHTGMNRFSRYLRLARHRRDRSPERGESAEPPVINNTIAPIHSRASI